MKEDLGIFLKNEYALWEHIYKEGGSDPFYEDGYNLNRICNHILSYRMQIEETMSPEEYPPEYFKPVPPEVANNYMAKPEDIRNQAKKCLRMYEKSQDYQYIKKNVSRLDQKQTSETCVCSILNYVSGLRRSLKEDRLVEMRRYSHPETYLASFSRCRIKMEEILGKELPIGQLSIFDLFEI